jgi:quinolinate synthase
VEDIRAVREQFPDVAVLTHPECSPEVVVASDYSGSTNAMIKFVQQSNAQHFLVLTECSMGDNIAAANPDKDLLRLCMVRCPHMNTITMENVRDSLLHNRYVIEVPEEIRLKAFQAVDRMIKIG